MKGANAKMMVQKFDDHFHRNNISDVKKVDFILWKLGGDMKKSLKKNWKHKNTKKGTNLLLCSDAINKQ
jgi:hypothetical protein